MNNKVLGSNFEKRTCEILRDRGYWVHFLSPDNRGAQPFDIIAVKDDNAYAIDCKTSKSNIFRYSRLEENQMFAFEYWMKCGNLEPRIFVEYEGGVYIINYTVLREKGKVKIEECDRIC